MTILYHEKQESALCGQHCLNNLLQGPYFNAGSLADLAHELDAMEQRLMMSEGMTADARRFLAEGSGNVVILQICILPGARWSMHSNAMRPVLRLICCSNKQIRPTVCERNELTWQRFHM